jgi:predicted glutamine amidotransferase
VVPRFITRPGAGDNVVCRFAFYLGPPITLSSLITEPTHSLIHQSYSALEREEPLNGDGFGVAYYVPQVSPQPAVFRSITPAWNNSNLLHLARVTRSNCVLAHVRAATQGIPVTETNCHPFTSGMFAFAHNGDVGGFRKIRRQILNELGESSFNAIHGTTDSEHLFALFLELYHPPDTPEKTGDSMRDALQRAIQRILTLGSDLGVEDPSYLNVVVTDGQYAAISRVTSDEPNHADSLYLHTGRKYVCRDGICQMVDPEHGEATVIVSSERLSDDPGWHQIPVNHLATVAKGGKTAISPFRR